MLTSDRAGAFGNGDLKADRRVASASLTSRILGKRALRCTCKLHKKTKESLIVRGVHMLHCRKQTFIACTAEGRTKDIALETMLEPLCCTCQTSRL